MTLSRRRGTFRLPVLLAGFAFALGVPACTALAQPKPLRVLFVGNSLTFFNDLPGTFASVRQASEPGTPVQADMLASGGATLGDRIADGRLAAMLEAGQYDLVVLQQIGGWPLCEPSEDGCEPVAALAEAVRVVRAHGARPFWLSTWKTSPAQQERLSAKATRIAGETGVTLVDAGAAMGRMPESLQRKLLLSDGHPDVLGTWLMAALLVRATSDATLPSDPPDSNCAGVDTPASTPTPTARKVLGGEPCHSLSAARWHAVRAAANKAR